MKPRMTAFLANLLATTVATQDGPTVKILNGTVQGSRCSSTDVNSFLSIPFAKPPLGELRFASPQPWDQSFNNTLDATKAAPACPQSNTFFAERSAQSEDCLFIEVWAPANATADSKLPVRVWLFGGGNVEGGISNPLYDGCYASTNTIQVSISYRIGALGFLAVESLGLTGNYGIQDQLLGLQWVQDNIAAFGGDKTKVLLFGESAGASDALIISTLPQAKSLFQAVILESSGDFPLVTLADASKANAAFVSALNCSTPDIACLRSVSVDALNRTALNTSSTSPLGVVLDGKLITSQPGDTGPKVPAIIGSTTNEASLALYIKFQSAIVTLNASIYNTYLTTSFGANASLVNQTYPLSRFANTTNPTVAAMSKINSDRGFRCPVRRLLTRSAASGIPVWTYSWNHTTTCSWYPQIPNSESLLELLGPTHSSELPFVFGVLDGLPRPGGNCTLSPAERELSTVVRAAWDGMARNAEPGGGWPKWSAAASMGVNIDADTWSVGKVDYGICDFWDVLDGVSVNGAGGGSGVPTNGSC